MLDKISQQLAAEKRSFQIGFDMATKYGIVLTPDHPMFDEAINLIWKHLSMGILGNEPIEAMLFLMIRNGSKESPTEK